MEFQSRMKFRHAETKSYEEQKMVRVMEQYAQPFWPGPELPWQLRGDKIVEVAWSRYHAPRIMAAATGKRQQFLTRFPGHTVPGLAGTERYAGSLSIERFEKMLELGGSLPPIGPFKNLSACPQIQFEAAPAVENWPWRIEQPELQVLCLPDQREAPDEHNKQKILWWLRGEIEETLRRGSGSSRVQWLVDQAWSPNAALGPLLTSENMDNVVCQLVRNLREESCNWLAAAFEIEASLKQIQYSRKLNIEGCGEYAGTWLEVGRLPLGNIRSTELTVTKRLLAELLNLQSKGFAPVIVNELGQDVDGTHRLTAAWIWNLLKFMKQMNPIFAPGENLTADNEAIEKFISSYRNKMGEVIVRESLRALAEIMRDREMRTVLETKVIPELSHYQQITHLPVVLLAEYSAGTVVKGPYDNGTGMYRVDPVVYKKLRENRAAVLPARGPYHLTDRSILPWFQILEPEQ